MQDRYVTIGSQVTNTVKNIGDFKTDYNIAVTVFILKADGTFVRDESFPHSVDDIVTSLNPGVTSGDLGVWYKYIGLIESTQQVKIFVDLLQSRTGFLLERQTTTYIEP